jgi:integrase
LSRKVWRDLGAVREDWIRLEFMHVTKMIDLPEITAPKTLRHCFATLLQDANVDPLIRNEVMGHSPASTFGGPHSLGDDWRLHSYSARNYASTIVLRFERSPEHSVRS